MIIENPSYFCHQCQQTTKWDIVLVEVLYHGVSSAYKCKQCGKIVPAYAMDEYSRNGRVVIPV